jgi:hypothetical protein
VVKVLAGESVPAEQRVSIGLVTAETLRAEAEKEKR